MHVYMTYEIFIVFDENGLSFAFKICMANKHLSSF